MSSEESGCHDRPEQCTIETASVYLLAGKEGEQKRSAQSDVESNGKRKELKEKEKIVEGRLASKWRQSCSELGRPVTSFKTRTGTLEFVLLQKKGRSSQRGILLSLTEAEERRNEDPFDLIC